MEMVNDSTFNDEVLQAEGLVVVDFGATWCGPCKKIEPILDEMTGEYEGRVKIRKVDVGVSPSIAQQYKVLSVPRVLFFKNGEVRDQITGLVPKNVLVEKFEEHLEKD
jgi:thioredoxin 1